MLFDARHSALSRDAWLGELRATLTLGWPLVLTNLAQIALTTTDVIVLGRVGASALAAATLGVNLYFAILIFGIGVVTATSPMMAEAFGRKLHMVRDVRRTFRQGIWASVLIAVPSWLLLWHTEAILLRFDQEPQLAADAQVFVRALQWGLLPTLGFIALRSFFAALERPLSAMMVTAAAILFNIAAKLGAGVWSSWSAGTWPARLWHRDDVVEHLPVHRAGAGGELWPQVPSLSSVR
jgi:MATE family multidrug resistance protein